MVKTSLIDIEKNVIVLITEIINPDLEKDLLPLGFLVNSSLRIVNSSIGKNTICVELNNSLFALSQETAKNIIVKSNG